MKINPSNTRLPLAIVAGVICIDLIPDLSKVPGDIFHLLAPGRLVITGPLVASTGGVVSNTGLALHRLGLPVRLIGKLGDDLLGQSVISLLKNTDPSLVHGMIVAEGEHTSYSVVLNPPDADRAFMYCTGANDTFCAEDISDAQFQDAGLFHFGYPPVMRHFAFDNGQEMARLFQRAHSGGLLTSLDMTMPDPDSRAGQMDWTPWFQAVLPHLDLLLPSLGEMRVMLHTQDDMRAMAVRLLDMGAAVVGLKLGDQGLYVRTTDDRGRLPGFLDDTFLDRELIAPCFLVKVAGTTGAGDCTNAGFLAGVLRGLPLEAVMTTAVAVGACNVEAPDAVSGAPTWEKLQARLLAGWDRRPLSLSLLNTVSKAGWRWNKRTGLWISPGDSSQQSAIRDQQ